MMLASIVVFGFAWLTMARVTTLLAWASPEKYQIPTRETRHNWNTSTIEYETMVWSLPVFGTFEKVPEIKDDYCSCVYTPIGLAKLNLFLWPIVLPHTIFRFGLRLIGYRGKTTGTLIANLILGRIVKGINVVATTVAKPIDNKKKDEYLR